jgi:hypothetical protein
MKTLLAVISLAALGGCAVAPAPAYYASRPVDPYQWHVVSSEPVQSGQATYPTRTEYTSTPIYTTEPVYVAQPVYVPAPVYAPQPAYYYPPVSIDLMFGGWWGGGHRRGGGWGAGFHGHR